MLVLLLLKKRARTCVQVGKRFKGKSLSLEELYYSPSLRESIAFAKLIREGVTAKEVQR